MAIEKVYSINEAAELLSLSKRTVFRYIQTGKIKAVKVGVMWRISEAELRRIMQGK